MIVLGSLQTGALISASSAPHCGTAERRVTAVQKATHRVKDDDDANVFIIMIVITNMIKKGVKRREYRMYREVWQTAQIAPHKKT